MSSQRNYIPVEKNDDDDEIIDFSEEESSSSPSKSSSRTSRSSSSSCSLSSKWKSTTCTHGRLSLTSPPSANYHDRRQRTWTIVLFSITTILLFADQNLMAPMLTEMAKEFNFTKEERDTKLGGDISLAFFLLGAPASLVIGCLADTYNRSILFAWTVLLGEGACFLTYFVQSYPQLYTCRAITGFSVGGAIPLIYSILGDLFPAGDRHLVSAIVSFGTGAGVSVGQAISGFLGPYYGWRLPFLVVSIPAMFMALLVWCTVRDPERGAMEESSSPTPLTTTSTDIRQQPIQSRNHDQNENDDNDINGDVSLVKVSSSHNKSEHLKNPCMEAMSADGLRARASMSSSSSSMTNMNNAATTTNKDKYLETVWNDQIHSTTSFWCIQDATRLHLQTLILLLSTPTVVLALLQGAPGCIPWGIINAFLNDYLSEDCGFSIPMATSILMCFSIGNAFGLFLLGGAMARFFYQNVDRRYPSLLAGFMAIAGCFPLWYLINFMDANKSSYWHVAVVAFMAGLGSGPTGPIIKATLTNVTLPRTRGQAFALFNLFDDFGKGLGPYFVSILILKLGGRLPAFNVGICGWVLCGILNWAVFWFVEKDEIAMQQMLTSEWSLLRRSGSGTSTGWTENV